jgi:hypothetical protein
MSEAGHELHKETRAAKLLRERLKAEFAGDPELAASMIEGETGIHEAIDEAARAVFEDTGRLTALDTMIDALVIRKDRIEQRILTMRAAICVAMQEAEIPKKDLGFCTVTRKPVPQSAQITDESQIPADYWKPQDPKLDKKAVLAALKAKVEIPGAALSNGGETIQMKWS